MKSLYFSHDSNAQHDPKIMKMMSKHGWEGYGLFWALVERLRNESGYKLEADYEVLAFGMRTQCERIKSIVEDFDLFVLKEDHFYSTRLNDTMRLMDSKSEKARSSARKRWERNANVMRTHSERNANKRKENKKNNIYSAKFEQFWHEYPSKIGKKKAFTSFKAVKVDVEVLIDAIKQQKETSQWKSGYIPHPATWLNQGRWEDDVEALNVKRNGQMSDKDYDLQKKEQRRLAENAKIKQKFSHIFEQ